MQMCDIRHECGGIMGKSRRDNENSFFVRLGRRLYTSEVCLLVKA